jgi:hypothetical protein
MKELKDMPGHSRLWVYTCNQPIEGELKTQIESEMKSFIAGWSSHGATMNALAEVVNKFFLIIALDESSAGASGCGIDKSVKKIQELEHKFGIQLLNRQLVVFENEGTQKVPLHQFWAMRKAGLINGNTLVYNSLVKNVAEYKEAWCIPFDLSWHKDMWGR